MKEECFINWLVSTERLLAWLADERAVDNVHCRFGKALDVVSYKILNGEVWAG